MWTVERLAEAGHLDTVRNNAKHWQVGRTRRLLDCTREEARAVHQMLADEPQRTQSDVDLPPKPEPDEVDEVEERGLKDQLAKAKRRLRETQRESYAHRLVRETAFKLAGAPTRPPKWLKEKRRAHEGKSTPTLFFSDLHWGEVVRPAEVGNLNEYNLEIAQRRLKTVVNNACDLLSDTLRTPEGYPGIVLALGGDMVSGSIHDELEATNEIPAIPATLDLRDHLVTAITQLADEFGQVFVPSVDGNHDRATLKKRNKRRTEHSYGWMLGNLLERHFRDDDRVTISVAEGTDLDYSIGRTAYRLTHGDQLGTSGGNGIIGCIGPIMRGMAKMRAASRAMGRGFDEMIIGHYHQLMWMKGGIVNGSLKGYCEYAMLNRFSPERAQQALWLTHEEHGRTVQLPVFADDAYEPGDGRVAVGF